MINENELITGLSEEEVIKRRKKYGLNAIQKRKKISAIKIFLSQFNDFIIWVLIAATIISGFMGEKADAITILIIIVLNAAMGFIQEFKTEKSLEALKELTAPTSKVLRGKSIKIINAEELVPGDIILIESGDRVPADSIILQGTNIVVDESLLTGESVGVYKNEKNNNIYMGTIVLTGKAQAKVTNIGMDTEMGKIANMLENIDDEKTPLKQKLSSLGKILVVICILICVIVTALGIMRGQDKYQMFLVGVSLAVAAIPEGLPAIVTVALALGVSRMLKRNALVRRLPAVETLGCTSVICSDKTGTLTQNKMTVKAVYYNDRLYEKDKYSESNFELLKRSFIYCNDCDYNFTKKSIDECLFGDPTETALIRAFFNDSSALKSFLSNENRISEIPFDSTRKMMSVVSKSSRGIYCYVKGAPERIIERCKYIYINGEVQLFTSSYKAKVNRELENMSKKALRCIACAYKDKDISEAHKEKDLIFIGIAGMIDPPRPEVKDAVLKCRTAGITPIMITGDHKNTAFAIGKELDICNDISEVMSGEELDKTSEEKLKTLAGKIKIFARVSPEHKLKIVRAFKSNNKIVAMTGDGVNDAPAVKEADIGISMGISGTDVTKEASAMILLDDNFATIISAVEEGRVIYNNIRKFIRYLLSCNLGEVITMFLASLFYLDTPLLPIQILLINLATDGLPALALGVDPADKDIMLEKPRSKNEGIFSRGLAEKIVIRGCLIGVCTVLSFVIALYLGYTLRTSRTIALGTLIMSQLIHVFECRSEKHSIFEIKLFTNPYLVGAVSISITMLLIVTYIPFMQSVFHTSPLNLFQWVIVIFFSGFISLVNSVYLYFNNK
ncbi:calcium-translocating P-type ATPase, PMCA-type [Clostridium hydrogenum]|uniref:calcium-translocating P-type ATPase, PMCA-type n=1 Tax=Clostridium hydrogenum TaxID=2855764 RepID=UPI002E317CF9|nr:calcium-translocating P-type ATPase, PMCA-type [Clostridium hydrogenum]